MNYTKLYENLIKSAKSKKRVKNNFEYLENHHILPKCLDGKDEEDNLVLLTAREHFLAHWLLSKIHKNDFRIIYAFNSFCLTNRGLRGKTSRLYKYAREKYILALKANDAWKKKMGKSMERLIWIKNPKTGMCFRVLSDSIKSFLQQGFEIGRIISHRKPHSDKTRKLIGMKNKGKIRSKDIIEAISNKSKNRVWINNGNTSKFVKKSEVQNFIDSQWNFGRLPFKLNHT